MSELVEPFQNIEGAQLRVAATLDARGYEMEFIRDDLADTYSKADFKEAYMNIIANQISADDFGKSIGFTNLNCQTFIFDEAIVFLFPSSRYDGVFISFDYEHPFPLRLVMDTASTIPSLSDEVST